MSTFLHSHEYPRKQVDDGEGYDGPQYEYEYEFQYGDRYLRFEQQGTDFGEVDDLGQCQDSDQEFREVALDAGADDGRQEHIGDADDERRCGSRSRGHLDEIEEHLHRVAQEGEHGCVFREYQGDGPDCDYDRDQTAVYVDDVNGAVLEQPLRSVAFGGPSVGAQLGRFKHVVPFCTFVDLAAGLFVICLLFYGERRDAY